MSWIRSERAAWVALGAAMLGVSHTWTLDPAMGFVVRDAGFAMVGIQWLQTALLHGADPWATPLGWPLPDPTTLIDWMPGEAVLGLPLRLLGADPYTQHTWIALAGLLLTGWACHRAAGLLWGPGPHTWFAGVVGGASSAQISHAQHLNLIHHEVAVGGGVLLVCGLVGRRPLLAGLGGGMLAGAGHFGAYMGLHAALVAGMGLLAAALARAGDLRSWRAAVLGGLLGGATMVPVWGRYQAAAARDHITVSAAELAAESWDLAETLRPLARAPLHDRFLTGVDPPRAGPVPRVGRAPTRVGATSLMDPPNPGYLAVALGLLGLLLGQRRPEVPRAIQRLPAAVLVVTLLLALGPWVRWDGVSTGVPGPAGLLDWVTGGPRLRAPARWFGLAWTMLGILGAGGLARLVGRRSPALQLGASLVAVGLALGETPRATVGPRTEVAIESAARRIDTIEGEGALYENHGAGCRGAGQLFHAAMFHGRPVVGGNYARAFEAIQEVNQIVASWPAPEARVFLRAIGTRVTYEHPPLRPLPPDTGRCEEVDGHRICALEPHIPPARFETGGAGPVVGLRWPAAPDAPTVAITCEGATVQVPTRVWGTLTRLRLGASTRLLEVYLDTPCPSVPTVSEGTPVPLHVGDPTPWITAFPPRPFRLADAP